MEEAFWQEKWARNEIGFHEADTNPLLLRHFPAFGSRQNQQLIN